MVAAIGVKALSSLASSTLGASLLGLFLSLCVLPGLACLAVMLNGYAGLLLTWCNRFRVCPGFFARACLCATQLESVSLGQCISLTLSAVAANLVCVCPGQTPVILHWEVLARASTACILAHLG